MLLSALLTGCSRPALRPAEATANDNRRPAGQLHGDTLDLALEVRDTRWRPELGAGIALPVQAFAEVGRAAEVPGPLIRVPVGTLVRIRLHNTLPDSTLTLHGLYDRPARDTAPVTIGPGRSADLAFRAGTPGTYFYWGSTSGTDLEHRQWLDSQLHGALIVDSAGATPTDRVFVIGIWSHFEDHPPPSAPDTGEVMTLNGLAWPHTEPIDLPAGDSVTWRLLNPSSSSHPMHLHGTYFALESQGDAARDTIYPPERRQLAVTQLLLTGGTAQIRWAARRPGNWLFHCHFAFHVSPLVSMAPGPTGAHHRMAGLVLGIRATGAEPAEREATPRALRLLVQQRDNRIGGGPGLGFVLQQGAEPARDSIEIPGTPLILAEGMPVAITVVNRLPQPSAVHWHGIELASFSDGVPDLSGSGGRIFRAIQPGDSFVARFTPPRSGTFIYHTHFDELEQMTRGLYGPLLVLPKGARYDRRTDHLVIVGGNGPATFPDTIPGLVNGAADPAPLTLAPGRLNRLRLINIDPDHRIVFTLLRDTTVVHWLALAKDGADLPGALRQERPAALVTGPGETADFGYVPRPGEVLTLRVAAPYVDKPWSRTLLLRTP